MDRIEKYRKFAKNLQFIGSIVIVVVGMVLLYFFGIKNASNGKSNNSLAIILGIILVLFMFLTFVGAPMQAKLLKLIIYESLNGLVCDVTFNRKKGYKRESFEKLLLTPNNFSQYTCMDYYSFKYNDLEVESTTVRAYDEIKVSKPKGKNSKKTKTVKEIVSYYFGRVYIIPFEGKCRINIYGKKNADVSRKKLLQDSEYNQELTSKVKKYSDNFEVFYKGDKPDVNVQAILEKLFNLKLQAKGPVSLFIRKNKMILCIDNSRHYEEVDIKNPINDSLVRDYRKDVSMVLSFINSMNKIN